MDEETIEKEILDNMELVGKVTRVVLGAKKGKYDYLMYVPVKLNGDKPATVEINDVRRFAMSLIVWSQERVLKK